MVLSDGVAPYNPRVSVHAAASHIQLSHSTNPQNHLNANQHHNRDVEAV
jgi:hypothetical protein